MAEPIAEARTYYSDGATGLLYWECNYPDSDGDGYDFGLGVLCSSHQRTVYFCASAHRLWCDGGPPDWEYHECTVLGDLPY